MTIGCIVQARMGSTRLPGKVLMEVIEGKPVLYYVINQLKYCKSFEKLIIATTTLPEDDKIVQFCTDNNVNYFRGDSKNVLERHYKCAEKFSLSTIIRMPSDKPLLDPEVVDKVVKIFNKNTKETIGLGIKIWDKLIFFSKIMDLIFLNKFGKSLFCVIKKNS